MLSNYNLVPRAVLFLLIAKIYAGDEVGQITYLKSGMSKKKQNKINGVKHYYICFLWVLLSFFLKVNFSWTGIVFPHSLSHHYRYLYNNDNNAKGSGEKPFGERMKVTLTFSCLVSTTRSNAATQNCRFSCTFKYV